MVTNKFMASNQQIRDTVKKAVPKPASRPHPDIEALSRKYGAKEYLDPKDKQIKSVRPMPVRPPVAPLPQPLTEGRPVPGKAAGDFLRKNRVKMGNDLKAPPRPSTPL